MKLFHGSPFLVDTLESRKPRGDTRFNKASGIYMTSSFVEASIYALTRDKERKNKSWGVKWIDGDVFLILKKSKWKGKNKKYMLNKLGYVYEYDTDKGVQNPDITRKTEYRINRKKIIPSKIFIVNIDEIKNNIMYLSDQDYDNIW